MNLDLAPTQWQLIEAIRIADTEVGQTADGWDVLVAVGITEMPEFGPGSEPLLSLLDWCLVFEELGASCRDIEFIRMARTLLQVASHDSSATDAADIFRSWAGSDPKQRRRDLAALVAQQADDSETAERLAEGTFQQAVDHDLIVVAAYALGVGRRCVELAQRRASERMVAGRRLLEHQGTSHRLAQCAVDLNVVRAALWRAADGVDNKQAIEHRAFAVAAASVSAALDCAHNVVQIHGAAGTSDPVVITLYRTVYSVLSITGSPRDLWQSAGSRWLKAKE